jgi:hypothetical protein
MTKQIIKASLHQRLEELLGPDFPGLDSTMSLSYSWNQGIEKLTVKFANGGGSEYVGAYHPQGNCEGNPCQFCGRSHV